MALIRAYVMVRVPQNRGHEISEDLRRLALVKSCNLVNGPYDIIMILEAQDLNEIATLITSKVHTICGTPSTVTCLVVTDRVAAQHSLST
jgi:DNA-binding Lrp family transcriptional regulator